MLSFIAEIGSLLFVVRSNQLIEYVSSRFGGLGIFPRAKNTRLPGLYKFSCCLKKYCELWPLQAFPKYSKIRFFRKHFPEPTYYRNQNIGLDFRACQEGKAPMIRPAR